MPSLKGALAAVGAAAAAAQNHNPVDLSQLQPRPLASGERRSDAHAPLVQGASGNSPVTAAFFEEEEQYPASLITLTTENGNFSAISLARGATWPVPQNCNPPRTAAGVALDPRTTVLAESFKEDSSWGFRNCTHADDLTMQDWIRAYNFSAQPLYEIVDLGFQRVEAPYADAYRAVAPTVNCTFTAGDDPVPLRVLYYQREAVVTICRKGYEEDEVMVKLTPAEITGIVLGGMAGVVFAGYLLSLACERFVSRDRVQAQQQQAPVPAEEAALTIHA